MAELSAANRTLIEIWTGPIEEGSDPGQDEDVETRLADGSPAQLVAIEILMIRKGEMIALATDVSSGNKSSSHAKNLERIDGQIAGAVAAVRANSNLSLTEAQELLVTAAEGGDPEASGFRTFTVETDNRRAG